MAGKDHGTIFTYANESIVHAYGGLHACVIAHCYILITYVQYIRTYMQWGRGIATSDIVITFGYIS